MGAVLYGWRETMLSRSELSVPGFCWQQPESRDLGVTAFLGCRSSN